MKKNYYIAAIAIGLIFFSFSCNNKKTYAEYLKDEAQAIDRFILKNNIEILRDFPSDGKFEENQYYKDPDSEVYFNVIEWGVDTSKKISFREDIHIRLNQRIYILNMDTISENFQQYYKERYVGPLTAYTKNSYSVPGWIVPINYNVGHRGKVKLIIPFNMGMAYDQSYFQPVFYDELVYRFDDQY